MMEFHNLILQWYDLNKRDLPWRSTKEPYKIWVSEIILQQTRVVNGIIYYHRFIEHFPNLHSLANADENDVLLIWQGLGYYSRARNLHFSAKYIVDKLNSNFPNTFQDIIKLKGIGDYTASAISSICFEEKVPAIDGNIFRILSRLFELKESFYSNKFKTKIKKLALEIMPNNRFGDYNQALMDYGSIICKPKNPLCSECVVSTMCKSFKKNKVHLYPVKKKKNKLKTYYYEYIIVIKENKFLIKKIDNGIWKNLFQFPVSISKTKQTKNELIKIFSQEIGNNITKFNLINKSFIEHRLSHLKIKSRFWLVNFENNFLDGIFTNDFNRYPMSKLMYKFINDYEIRLSKLSKFKLNNYYVRNTK